MRTRLFWCAILWLVPAVGICGADGAIKKVLPHFLDHQGRHTLSPSLYERDAYQDYLRDHPEERSALRFDVLCRAPASTNLFLQVEVRGSREDRPTLATAKAGPFDHPRGREWYAVVFRGEAYARIGRRLAWRARLWEGERLVAESKSFLWQVSAGETPP